MPRLRSVAGLAWSAFRAFQLRRQYRHAVYTLDRLDETMLRDMGISRVEIGGGVYRRSVECGARGEDPLG
jgi:uncharacterized protein YjiS (DUF1127 family)